MRRRAPVTVGTAAALLPLATGPSAAHVLVPGVSGLASLVLHPFAGVETLLVIVAAAIVVGASERPWVLWTAALAGLVGGTLGALLQAGALAWPGLWRLPLVVAAALGAMAALGRTPGSVGCAAAACLAAITLGLGLTPERPGLSGILEAAVAAAAALALALVAIALPRMLLRHPVARLAGRIAGAWMLAIAMLGLAASLR